MFFSFFVFFAFLKQLESEFVVCFSKGQVEISSESIKHPMNLILEPFINMMRFKKKTKLRYLKTEKEILASYRDNSDNSEQ